MKENLIMRTVLVTTTILMLAMLSTYYLPSTFINNVSVQANKLDKSSSNLSIQQEAIKNLSQKVDISIDKDGIPNWIAGNLAELKGDHKAAAVMALEQFKPIFRASKADSFEPKQLISDTLGQTHVKLQQKYKNLPVIGKEMIVHFQGEKVISINGKFQPDINISTKANLVAEIAIDSALSSITDSYQKNSEPQLVILINNEGNHLAWGQAVSYQDRSGIAESNYIFVDANNGHLLASNSLISYAAPIQLYNNSQYCELGAFNQPPINPVSSDEINVYSNLKIVRDFYQTTLKRDSFDNQGTQIDALMHSNCDTSSNFQYVPFGTFGINWQYDLLSPINRLVVTDGDGFVFRYPGNSLSLVAHEFTHGVINSSAHLSSNGEPGALSESFADVMAVATKFNATGTLDWKIGDENVFLPGTGKSLRYMNDPPLDLNQNLNPPQFPPFYPNASVDYYPDIMSCNGCISSAANDYKYVHYNSGIPNLAFYLLVHGGQHPEGKTNITVQPIDIKKATAIWYRALTTYMLTESNMSEAFNATVHAATDLYGFCSIEAQNTQLAWLAVGVPPNCFPVGVNIACSYNLLVDPGFESAFYYGLFNSKPWQDNTFPVGYSSYIAGGSANEPTNSGYYMATFGRDELDYRNPDLSKYFIYQTIDVPKEIAEVYFRVRSRIKTNKNDGNDVVTIDFCDLNNNPIFPITQFTNTGPNVNSLIYANNVYNVTSIMKKYAGQKIRLVLHMKTNSVYDSIDQNGKPIYRFNTQFYFDDLELTHEQ